jgi:CheY-like chemotaxis protein
VILRPLGSYSDSSSTRKKSMRYPLKGAARFKTAQENLAPPERLIVHAMDGGPVAIMDEGWPEELITDEHRVANLALGSRVLALTEQKASGALADELIRQGIELARLENFDHAEFMFKTAITVAMRCGAQDKVALTALTMLEELDQMPARTMFDAIEMALEMPESMGTEMLRRVSQAAAKVIKRASARGSNQEATEVDCKLPTDLEYEMLLYERSLFRNALINAQGSLIQAARSVGLKPGKLLRRLRVEHQPLLHRLRPPVRLPGARK